jgi:hypothetical protein
VRVAGVLEAQDPGLVEGHAADRIGRAVLAIALFALWCARPARDRRLAA